MEQANPRHEHEWRLWEDVDLPEGKVLVPGVVTHHTNVVEHPQLVADRLVRLAKLVGRESVMGGTDCGFAQGAFLQRVHPTIQWAKLEALAEGARIATKQLFGAGAVAVIAARLARLDTREPFLIMVRARSAWRCSSTRRWSRPASGWTSGWSRRPTRTCRCTSAAAAKEQFGARMWGYALRPDQLLPDRRRGEHDDAHAAGDRGLRSRSACTCRWSCVAGSRPRRRAGRGSPGSGT